MVTAPPRATATIRPPRAVAERVVLPEDSGADDVRVARPGRLHPGGTPLVAHEETLATPRLAPQVVVHGVITTEDAHLVNSRGEQVTHHRRTEGPRPACDEHWSPSGLTHVSLVPSSWPRLGSESRPP